MFFVHFHPYLSHFQGMWSNLSIPGFHPRSWDGHLRWCWYTPLSFSVHWFLAPHASQFAKPFRSYFESELECRLRQPDHRRSQGHLGILLNRKKSPTVCLGVIFRWLFSLRNWLGWGKAYITLRRANIAVSTKFGPRNSWIQNAFPQNLAALKLFIEQLDEWEDLLR